MPGVRRPVKLEPAIAVMRMAFAGPAATIRAVQALG